MVQETLLSDDELIERLRSGDHSVVELLVTRYWSPLCQYAEGILDGVADPEDVVQEAFIRLWSRRLDWRSEGSVRALLYTITRNAALDEHRGDARRDKVSRAADGPSASPSPVDDALAGELREAARAAVHRLPPKRREIFRLAREERLTYSEIASVLGLSPQTVANHMSLALADLRRELADYRVEEAPST